MMRFKLTTKKLLVIVAALLVLSAAGLGFGIWIMQGDIRALAELDKQVDRFELTDTSLAALETALNDAEGDAQLIDNYFVSPDGVVSFISEIEGLARESSISLNVRSIESEETEKSTREYMEKIVVRIETSGRWSGTDHFLKLVEHLPYGISIEDARLERNDGEGSSSSAPNWRGDFIITALKLK